MIKNLYDYLYDNDVDVYFPGQHKGECKTNYVVIKEGSTSSDNGKVASGLIDLLFFVPKDDYLECEVYKDKIKELMKSFSNVRETGNETGPVTDDDVKAYTFSIMYQIYKRV